MIRQRNERNQKMGKTFRIAIATIRHTLLGRNSEFFKSFFSFLFYRLLVLALMGITFHWSFTGFEWCSEGWDYWLGSFIGLVVILWTFTMAHFIGKWAECCNFKPPHCTCNLQNWIISNKSRAINLCTAFIKKNQL